MKLSVNLNRNNKSVEIWTSQENSEDLWTMGTVYLGRIPRDFKVKVNNLPVSETITKNYKFI